MTRRRTGSAPRTSNTSDLRSGDSSVESREDTSGNRTTLTFGEMVGIYHDIWNAMLLGGKTTQNLHFPCICISIRASCNSREFSAFQRRENQQLGRIKWPELRRRERQHSRVTRPNIEHTDSHTDLTRLTDSCPLSLSLSQHPQHQHLTAPSLKNVVIK